MYAKVVFILFAALGLLTAAPPPAGAFNGEEDEKCPPGLSKDNPAVQRVMAVQAAVTDALIATDGILGTAVGCDSTRGLGLQILVNSGHANMAEIIRGLPETIKGVPVKVEVTDRIEPMPAKLPAPAGKPGGGGGVSHTAKQNPPIQLGTSGGWRYDLANGYCCGGTLGSLVQINGMQYILSNYHVLEADIVSGGNNRVAQNRDPVTQPGLIDVSCSAASAQNVATLEVNQSLPDSNVDAAIAQVISGMVKTDGAILEIGTISEDIVGPRLNQAVKKSGRTTGLTRSTVSGLNATVTVTYDNECAGGTAFTKKFTGQILIKNKASKFLAAGDSGSLMVEDVTTSPRAVGLLFAGSSSIAVANPIGEVLSFLGATMVGN